MENRDARNSSSVSRKTGVFFAGFITLLLAVLIFSGLSVVYAGEGEGASDDVYQVTVENQDEKAKDAVLYVEGETTADQIIASVKKQYRKTRKNVTKVVLDKGSKVSVSENPVSENNDSLKYKEMINKIVKEKYIRADVTTVTKKIRKKSVKYKTIVKKTKKVRKNTTKIRKGKAGIRTTTYTTTRVNGVKSSVKKKTVLTKKPVKKIIYKGTGSVKVKKGKKYTGTSGEEIVKFAKKHVGNPYVYGGTSLTRGCDCSGFVFAVYKHFGLNLPRVGQHAVGKRVSVKNLKPGDILNYRGHVAIYAGNKKVVHAVNPRRGIRVTSMYYNCGERPYRATRIVK